MLYFLRVKPNSEYGKTILYHLAENTQQMLSDLLPNEEFVSRLLYYTNNILQYEELRENVFKIWQQVARVKKNLFRVMFALNFDALSVDILQSPFQVENNAASDMKKFDDKEILVLKDSQQERFNQRDKKQILIQKTQDKMKSNFQLVTNALLSYQQQQIKSYVDELQHSLEEDKHIRRLWKMICQRVTTERSVWAIENPSRWHLDPTEGTDRMRIRLKQTAYIVPFLNPSFSKPLEHTKDLLSPSEIMSSVTQQVPEHVIPIVEEEETDKPSEMIDHNHIKPGERIIAYYKCSRINPSTKRDGEILIGESHAYFIDDSYKTSKNKNSAPKNLTWNYHDIREIHKRRYLLKNNALEIFLLTGKTYLLAFENQSERDKVYDQIMALELPNRVDYEYEVSGGMLKKSITKKWTMGLISNFEYLMHLNTLSGRSFNDLTQYPVFPFILADYISKELDFNNANAFRDLSKPMGAQDSERMKKFLERYAQLLDMGESPFHYGSHYSNLGKLFSRQKYVLILIRICTSFSS